MCSVSSRNVTCCTEMLAVMWMNVFCYPEYLLQVTEIRINIACCSCLMSLHLPSWLFFSRGYGIVFCHYTQEFQMALLSYYPAHFTMASQGIPMVIRHRLVSSLKAQDNSNTVYMIQVPTKARAKRHFKKQVPPWLRQCHFAKCFFKDKPVLSFSPGFQDYFKCCGHWIVFIWLKIFKLPSRFR